MSDRDIKKFIHKFNIKNILYVNSFDQDSINNYKKQLFHLIKNDIFNKIFINIKQTILIIIQYYFIEL